MKIIVRILLEVVMLLATAFSVFLGALTIRNAAKHRQARKEAQIRHTAGMGIMQGPKYQELVAQRDEIMQLGKWLDDTDARLQVGIKKTMEDERIEPEFRIDLLRALMQSQDIVRKWLPSLDPAETQ